LGEISLSAAVPLLAEFQLALSASLGIATPELDAKLAGLTGILAAITVAPPDLTGTIEAAIATVANLQASIGGPVVTLEAAAIIGLIAELNVSLGILAAGAALSIPSANLSAYVFDGESANLGAELQSAINADLPGVPARTYALLLATTSSSAWTAAQLVFKTS
jgi:hypothetical protein